MDGAAPITIGEHRSVALTADLYTPADPADAAVAAPATPDSERLLAVLESGEDPFGILEATAAIAGEPGGDDGGSCAFWNPPRRWGWPIRVPDAARTNCRA